jgi:hypothetical protein
MPDDVRFRPGISRWFYPREQKDPDYVYFAPKPLRPEVVVDHQAFCWVDPDNNFIGFDDNWGRGGPLGRVVYVQRTGTRDL